MKSIEVLAAATLAALILAPATALAHGGGTDGCGGHHDQKRGGYHVHDYSAYCGCYPRYAVCVNYLKDEGDDKAPVPAPADDNGLDGTGNHTDDGTGDGTPEGAKTRNP